MAATAGLLATAAPNETDAAADVVVDPNDRFRREWGYTLLEGKALARFLGPVSPTFARWYRQPDAGSETYHGLMIPPLRGEAGVIISTWQATHMPEPGGSDSLGVLPGEWSKSTADGKYSAQFGFANTSHRWLLVYITAHSEADRKTIIREFSRLPMFNATADTPFRNIEKREQALRVLAWLLPAGFVASLWLTDRFLRRRNRSALVRSSLVALVSAGWLLGLLLVAKYSSFGLERAVVLVARDPRFKLWLVPAAAACISAVLILVAAVLVVRRIFLQRVGTRPDEPRA